MQITVKRLMPMIAALCVLAPAQAMAQTAEDQQTPTETTQETTESQPANNAESQPAAADNTESQPAAADNAESQPAAAENADAQAAENTDAQAAENADAQAAANTDAQAAAEAARKAAAAARARRHAQPRQPSNDDTSAETNNTSDDSALPNAIASKKSSQEARKQAMKNLSNSYPVDAASQKSEPVTVAANNDPASSTPTTRTIPAAAKTSERMPFFEHHGYFRTRLNVFGNYDLDTRGTSPVAVPLDSKHRGAAQQEHISMNDEDAHLGANIRFRYQPEIHISESIRIASSFDIMDNFVLGTSPNGLRTNWGSDSFFTFNGAEPVNSKNFGQNAISVKSLYGEADTLIGTFRAGRIPAHWGLGIIYNVGGVYKRDQQQIEGKGWKCIDCDSSDAIDRVEWQIRDPFFDFLYLAFSWDFVNSGLASYNLQQDSLGQSFDLAETDDVLQFTLSLFDRPISQQAVDERARALYETRHWTYDWGVLFSYRSQEKAPEIETQQMGDGVSSTYDLYNKDATAYVIDLWARFFVPCPKEVTLRLETEFVGVFGDVKLDRNADGQSRDITQIGFAFEGEVWWRDLITGLKTGIAWADDMVYSGHPVIDQLDVVPMGSILRFDPNYAIDQIMFRELMGGINNAWYLNLYGEYKFPISMPQYTTSLGARLDLSTATAMVQEATPGDAKWYGFEAGAKLFYDESDRFRFEIGAGFLVPGDAWAHRAKSNYPILPSQSVYEASTSDAYDPKVAWNVIANLFFMF